MVGKRRTLGHKMLKQYSEMRKADAWVKEKCCLMYPATIAIVFLTRLSRACVHTKVKGELYLKACVEAVLPEQQW